MLSEASPALIATAYDCTLTFCDPATSKHFLRQVVLVNIGKGQVKHAQLTPLVQEFVDKSKVLWVQAFGKWDQDEWNQLVVPSRAPAFAAGWALVIPTGVRSQIGWAHISLFSRLTTPHT